MIRFKGILKLDPQKTVNGKYYGRLFYELEHYFNESMEEVKMISFSQSQFENETIFNPPRKWSKEVLKDYLIVPV